MKYILIFLFIFFCVSYTIAHLFLLSVQKIAKKEKEQEEWEQDIEREIQEILGR